MPTEEEIKELVITRLEVLPPNKKISIGSSGEFSREEMIEHIKKGDEVGKKMVEVELGFLRALKEGLLDE